jgi:CRISPR/Cas system-associated exonuclease Cas4 (RecB family)
MQISYSSFSTYNTCPKQYQYRYIHRIKTMSKPANLLFGDALHHAIAEWFLSGEKSSLVQDFQDRWTVLEKESTIEYNSTYSREDIISMGIKLMQRFPDKWYQTGLVPYIDEHGPMVEREIDLPLSETVNLKMFIDIVTFDPALGTIQLIDFKSAASAHTHAFGEASQQLDIYQLGLKNALEIDVDRVGYMDMIKRKVSGRKGPTVEDISWYPAREKERIQRTKNALEQTAKLIENQIFYEYSGGAFNSPCNLCAYQGLCTKGDKTNLIFQQAA